MIHTTVFKQKNYLVVAFIIFAYTGKKLNIVQNLPTSGAASYTAFLNTTIQRGISM